MGRYRKGPGTAFAGGVQVKSEWIVERNSSKVAVLFNGWGMDAQTAYWLMQNGPVPDGIDILVCWDYRDPQLSPTVRERVEGYDEVIVISWSLGVAGAMSSGLCRVDRAVAFNGTRQPLGRETGIDEGLFQATLDSWSEASRQRFMRRICGGNKALDRFRDAVPLRSVEEQKEELRCIQDRILSETESCDCRWDYSRAIVGGRDLIFPADVQKSAWNGYDVLVVDDMPHVPWLRFDSWQEVLACVQ